MSTTLQKKYYLNLTDEARKLLEEFDKRFQRVIISHAMLFANDEGSILINESHIKKSIEKVFVLKHSTVSKIKWFSYITPLILLPFVFAQISQIANSLQIFPWLFPITVLIWVLIYCYIFLDFIVPS